MKNINPKFINLAQLIELTNISRSEPPRVSWRVFYL